MPRYQPVDTGPNWRAVNEDGYCVSPEFCTLRETEAWIASQEQQEDDFRKHAGAVPLLDPAEEAEP